MPLPNERVYFPFFGGDWIRRTAALPPAARGYYIDLVVFLWDDETRALPGEERLLMQIARATSPRDWRAAWPLLLPFLTASGPGYRDPWVDDCRTRVREFSERQSIKGRASAAKRAAARQPDTQPGGNRAATNSATEAPTQTQLSDPDPLQNQQDQGGKPPVRTGLNNTMKAWRDEPPSLRVITRVAHDVLSDIDAGTEPRGDDASIGETLKRRCASYGLTYDSRTVQKALDSARWQRAHKVRGVGPVPTDAPVDAACWLVAELLKYHGGNMPRERLNEVIFEAARMQWTDDKFADAVIRLAWLDDTLRMFPQWFALEADGVRLVNWRA